MCGEALSLLKRNFKIVIVCLSILFSLSPCEAADSFMVLCYHDIPRNALTPEDVPQHIFVKQLEYLKTHGYNLVSPEDIRAAAKGTGQLPDKAVLLTFDDAYLSFYEFVYPVLQLYGYPAVLSIVTSWIDSKPEYVGDKELMSWDQIQEVLKSGIVYAASHTHDMHKGVTANPSGNEEAATSALIYLSDNQRYENEDAFRVRISQDLEKSRNMLKANASSQPYMITWPYGQYNQLTVEEGQKLGCEMMFTLMPGPASVDRLDMIGRNIITQPLELEGFIEGLKNHFTYFTKRKMRVAQIDLDMIVNPDSYAESDHNLGLLIDRLVALGVNTVFIQGFCDRDASGTIRSLYFNNSMLPVELDFLSHVTNRIRIRGMQVYIWMPVLSYELPDRELNENLKVREYRNNTIDITSSWYKRLSPFDERSLKAVKAIYRDLSAYVRFDGILFQDDAYLSDSEDFHPSALRFVKEQLGVEITGPMLEEDHRRDQWVNIKTARIDWFIEELKQVVRHYKPMAQFARNIYSEVVLNPESQKWFSQNFENYLERYDFTVVMAYPQMEEIGSMRATKKWLSALVDKVKQYQAQGKVLFKIQSYDWSDDAWIDEEIITQELRYLLSLGVKHVGYYPDNPFENRPRVEEFVSIISAREFPKVWEDEFGTENN